MTATRREIKMSEFVKPVSFEVYLHNPPDATYDCGCEPAPREGYVPDVSYRLERYYQHISTRYTRQEPTPEDKARFIEEVPLERFRARQIVVVFNRYKDEKRIKGARFTSPLRADLVKFLDDLQDQIN